VNIVASMTQQLQGSLLSLQHASAAYTQLALCVLLSLQRPGCCWASAASGPSLSVHERTTTSLVRSTPGHHTLIGKCVVPSKPRARRSNHRALRQWPGGAARPTGYTPTAVDEGESAAASLLGVHEVRRMPPRTGQCSYFNLYISAVRKLPCRKLHGCCLRSE